MKVVNESHFKKHIFVCTNQKANGKVCCANTGGEPFFDYLKAQLNALALTEKDAVRVSKSGCLGRCSLGPCMVIYPEAIWYTYSTLTDVDEIIHQHVILGQTVERLLINP